MSTAAHRFIGGKNSRKMIPLNKLPSQIRQLGESVADFIRERDLLIRAEMTDAFDVLMVKVRREYMDREVALEDRINCVKDEGNKLLESQRKEMDAVIKVKQDEIESLRLENSKLSDTINVMSIQSRQNASLLQLLNKEQAELQEAKTKLFESYNRISSLEELNQSYVKAVGDKDGQLTKLLDAYTTLSLANEKLSADVQTSNKRYDSLQIEFKDYAENKDAKMGSLQDEVRKLKIQLSSASEWGETLSLKVRELNTKLAACDKTLIDQQCESLLRVVADLMGCLHLQESISTQLKGTNAQLEINLRDTQRQKELDRLILPFMHAPKLSRNT